MGGKATLHKSASVEKANAKLEEMASQPKKKDAVSTKEAIAALAKSIRKAQAAGYTLDEIINALKESGVEIGLSSLKAAMREQSGNKPAAKKVQTASKTPAGNKKAVSEKPPKPGYSNADPDEK